MKLDKRQVKTRQAILDAYLRLLTKNEYEKISVKDIIEEANVGRSTFYSHYETKDDLTRVVCKMLFHHVFRHDIPPCSTHDFSEQRQNAENRVAHMLYHVRDKHAYYDSIIKHEEGQMFLRFFREYMLENIRIVLRGPNRTKFLTVPDDFLVNHITSSFVGMIRWWIQKDFQPSPEEVARYFVTACNPAINEFDLIE